MVSHTLCVESTKRFGYIKRAKDLRILGALSTVTLLLLSAVTVFPITDQADDVEAAYIPASIPTINITSASNIASVDITPNSASGTFVSSSSTSGSEVTFGVTTDNLTGYTVAVAARSGDTSGQLTNASYGDTIDSISTTTSETDFSTGAASTYSNKWGIKPSKYNSTLNTNGDFLPAPTTSELVLDTTNSPNPTTANTYTIGLGARVDYTKPVGTYTNTYILQAVGNQISYQISYSDTTSDASVTNIPATDGNNDIEAAGFTLSSTTPTRTGYSFAGWCDGTVTHVNLGNSTCAPNTTTGTPGTTYAAGTSYNFSSLSTSSMNNATLYAMWDVNTYSLTASFNTAEVTSVKVCTVAGNCSGTNLKGTISSSGGSVSGLVYATSYYLYPVLNSHYSFYGWTKTSTAGTLSSTTATNPTFTMGLGNGAVTVTGRLYFQNATSSDCGKTMYDNRSTAAYKNIAYTTAKIGSLCYMTRNLDLPGGTALTNSDSNLNGSLTSFTLPASGVVSSDGMTLTDTSIFGGSNSEPYVFNSGNTTCSSSSPCYSYYSWAAATAGTNPTTTSDATSDICPKGWRLPTKTDYTTLKDAYNSGAALIAAPFSGVYSGYYDRGHYNGYEDASYWSGSTSNGPFAFHLVFSSSSDPSVSIGRPKGLGMALRCVAKS